MKELPPKEKAEQLYDKFYPHTFHPHRVFNTDDKGGHTKECALMIVRVQQLLLPVEIIGIP